MRMYRETGIGSYSLGGFLLTLALALSIASPGCAAEGAAEKAAAPDSEPEVMARIGEQELTRAELEERLAQQLAPLRQQRRQLLMQGIDAWMAEQLVEREVEATGRERSALIQQEVRDKVQLPTEEEMQAFYEQNRARLQGRTFEQMKPQIQTYLVQQRQQQLQQEWIGRLEQKYLVATYLEPIRFDVDDAEAPAIGPLDAPVTVVEFSDFQCPYCARMVPVLEQTEEKYGDQVRIVYRHFPLDNLHPHARKAAEASLCAADQGKFWELHDAMFADQSKLSSEDLKTTASELGLDTEAFGTCLDSGEYTGEVQADLRAGASVGVTGTPSVFVNGRKVGSGAVPFEQLSQIIDDELQRASSKARASDS